MGEATFQVVFLGNLRPGTVPEAAIDSLVSVFGLDRSRAEELVGAGRQMIVKKGATRKQAMAIRQRLEQAGLLTRMVEETADTAGSTPEQSTAAAPAKAPPVPGRAAERAANPYAAPRAKLEKKQRAPARASEPARVPAGHGWRWITGAITMFLEQPFTWVGAIVLMYLVIFVVNMVPVAGPLIGYLIGPLLTGGLMIGAHELNGGGRLKISHLFAGFSHNRNQLLLIGVILCLAGAAGMLAIFLFTGSMFGLSGGQPPRIGSPPSLPPGVTAGSMLLFVLVGLLVGTLFIMATWFASVLVAVEDYTAIEAMKTSFRAVGKNWLAFLVSSLSFLLLAAGVGVVIGIAVAILGKIVSSPAAMIFMPLLMVVLIGLPAACMGIILVYTSFRDIFYS